MKIILIVATKCHILTLKCTNPILAGVPPQAPEGNLQRSSDPLADGGRAAPPHGDHNVVKQRNAFLLGYKCASKMHIR